ncbi:MAG: hypothetical protein GX078_02520 [Clostridiales bacterium]|nr:hypothetical protein [Clostridiales bacterium]
MANINLIENEIETKYTFVASNDAKEAPEIFVNETIEKANAKGIVSSMLIALSSVKYAKYTSLNGVTAIYDITKSPNIYIDESEEGQGVLATAYYKLAQRILGGADDTLSIYKFTQSIQEAYANENGGELPMFSGSLVGDEVTELMKTSGLKYNGSFNVDSLKWIPSSTSDKQDIIMYAGLISGSTEDNPKNSGNINSAGIAYYNGNYYYHVHSSGRPNEISGSYVGDRGADTDKFKELEKKDAGARIDGFEWVKFEQ